MNSPAPPGHRPKGNDKNLNAWVKPGYLTNTSSGLKVTLPPPPFSLSRSKAVASASAAANSHAALLSSSVTPLAPPRLFGYMPVEPGLTPKIGVGGYSYAKDERLSYSQMVTLILPVTLLDAMAAECKAHEEALKAQRKKDDGGEDEGEDREDGGAGDGVDGWPGDTLTGKLPASPQSKADQKGGLATDLALPLTVPLPLLQPYEGRLSLPVSVYGPQEIEVLTQAAQTRSKSEKVRYEDTHKRLQAMGHLRHLLYPTCQGQHLAPPSVGKEAGEAKVAVETARVAQSASQRAFIQSQFNDLRERFPHFGEVIEIYQTSALAAARTGSVMSPPPVLMLGVPGVGKTHFAQALAECLGLPMLKLGFDTGLTNSALLGSDQHWGNTHHGQLFEYLCLRQVANPVVFLDELDKASTARAASGHQSALSALHSCLEPSSAGEVKDISFGMTMDASYVIWLAATNDADAIVPSLRSRFTEVTIRPPIKPEQMYQLNWHICKAVVEPLGVQMPNSVIRTCIAVLSPREQRKHLEAACQAALAQDRDQLEEGDFAPGVIEPLDGFGRTPNDRRNGKRVGARSHCGGEMLH